MPKTKGSILAYSLIIISIMVAITASLSVATVLNKKSANSTSSSVQAYQTADSGVQLAFKKINKNQAGDIEAAFPDCNDGIVSDQGDASRGEYELTFYDSSNVKITNCSASIGTIDSIKSVGKFKDTVRAVQVAVCTPESDADFCDRLGKECGSVTDDNNCGNPKTVASCGDCLPTEECSNNVCAPSCTPESGPALCSRLGKNCDSLTATEIGCNTTITVNCGSCDGNCIDNVCMGTKLVSTGWYGTQGTWVAIKSTGCCGQVHACPMTCVKGQLYWNEGIACCPYSFWPCQNICQ